ncbi:MAG: hypothetical protein A4S14_20665 [Proteobacteria bacterium SG_bin9]|nr:MAG: hypothetical protein A4S14_20665 [Proteobacteria bacterium SG_bin9]
MQVMECKAPAGSLLGDTTISQAYFHDSYSAPLSRDQDVASLFFAIFGHRPRWMTWTLLIRNKLAAMAGLEAATTDEFLSARQKDRYAVGDKIGIWPIYALSDTEVVAGRDNTHLDFRVSILKASNGDGQRVVVTTVCKVHNLAGRVYLFFIVPFHRLGVRQLLTNAVRAGRI